MLIDVVTGAIEPIEKTEGSDVFLNVPVRDSVMAIAGQDYFDWPVLPETPHSLKSLPSGNVVRLHWEGGGDDSREAFIERRDGDGGTWTRIAGQSAAIREYTDGNAPSGVVCYRVRTANASGESAYSNVARLRR